MAKSIEKRCSALEYGIGLIKQGEAPGKAWADTGDKFGINKVTLYRWFNKIQASPRSAWPELLATKYISRKAADIPKAAWEFFIQQYETIDPPSIMKAYKLTYAEAVIRHWIVPSERTFRRQMDRDGIKRRSRYDNLP